MKEILGFLIPAVFALGLTPNTTTYTNPNFTDFGVVKPDKIELPNSSPQAISSPTEEVIPIECSCVKYAQSLIPEIPLWDAIDYPVNTIKPKVGDIIKLQYYNATTTNYTYHIAVIKEITEEGYQVKEANYEKCKEGERFILLNDDNIIGFFSLDLWKIISNLPLDIFKTLQCESNFSMYEHNTVKRGKDGEWGIAQFMQPTWRWMTDIRRRNGEKEILLDILNPYDQIKQMQYMWDLGYQNHWSAYKSKCYENLGTSPVGWTNQAY